MKKLLLLFTFALSTLVNAQPTLTQANCAPTVGFNCNYYTVPFFQPGSAGANQTWNFTSFPTTTSNSESYLACSAAPSCSQLTGTNVVAYTPSTASYAYYISSSATYAMRGLEASGIVFDFTDVEDMMRFPLTFNNNYTDNFSENYTASGMAMVRTGSVTVTADAWGKVMLPTGTFNNVLRVHRVKNYQDFYMGNPILTSYENQYFWIQPNNHEFIMFTDSLNTASSSTTVAYFSDLSPASVTDMNSSVSTISLSPIPAKNKLDIRFQHSENGNVAFSVVDMTGRVVLQNPPQEYSVGKCAASLDISSLAPGVYVLQLSDGVTLISRKMEVY